MSLRLGTFKLFLGWAVQILAGYLMKKWLATELGPAEYGNYGIVMSILLWIEMGAINGLSTATQKFVADHPDNARCIVKEIFRMQMLVNAVLFSLFFLLAPVVASFLKDMGLSFLIRIALWDIWIYSIYFLFFSLMNGLHNFGKQALLIAFYSVTKLVFVILLVKWTDSVQGAFIANIVSSFLGMLLGIILSKSVLRSKEVSQISVSQIIRFAIPVALNVLIMQLFFNIDLWFIKFYCPPEVVGFYCAASDIARIPYFLFFALSAVVMPMLSSALSRKDQYAIDQTIRGSIRMMSMILIPVAALTFVFSRDIVLLIFKETYASSSPILNILIWGISLFAFYFLLVTIMNADNRPKLSMYLTLVVVVIDIVLNAFLVPKLGGIGGAVATSCALLSGCIATSILVIKRFKVFLSGITLIRIVLSSGLVALIGHWLPIQGLWLFPAGTLLAGLYLILLILLKEIRVSEITRILKYNSAQN